MRTSEVEETLSKMLRWREGREEYEECGEILKLSRLWEDIIVDRLKRGDE
jgi:hypothetical protein